MKKMISLILVLSMFLSLAATASATGVSSAPAVEMHGDVTFLDIPEVLPTASTYPIPGINPKAAALVVTCNVTRGVTKIHITSCSCSPHTQVQIGFCNVTTGAMYGRNYNGPIANVEITSENVPSGTYYLYIMNNGSTALTGGTLEYYIYE